ncbi:MAG: hypothetical protein LBT26_03110 [Clostridiales Family XIII bacterium]|nr:hypothetical protein [Clostridiales Family XIII bacterium]
MKNSKRGTAMVEAAIIFPLMIAAVMAVIYLMVNLYSLTALQASLHTTLRAQAGAHTGLTENTYADGRVRDRYRQAAERRGPQTEEHKAVLSPYLSVETSKTYSANALAARAVQRRSFGRYYVLDEVKSVQNVELAKHLKS